MCVVSKSERASLVVGDRSGQVSPLNVLVSTYNFYMTTPAITTRSAITTCPTYNKRLCEIVITVIVLITIKIFRNVFYFLHNVFISYLALIFPYKSISISIRLLF